MGEETVTKTIAPVPARSDETREMRLAVVCYGGVSLAIYMHGITRELHSLVRASVAYEQDSSRNPFPPARIESVYWDALERLHDRDQVRTRVIVDIISGTSAGGINGIYLAKALAGDLSQEKLRDLWMDKGDIRKLTHPKGLPLWLRAVWFLLKSKGAAQSPLDGDAMCAWLLEALDAMDQAENRVSSLMPRDQLLELFVTVTDMYGYDVNLPISNHIVNEGRHRHVLHFQHSQEMNLNHFSPGDNVALGFVARATSSFPGAFSPITLDDFEDATHRDTSSSHIERLFRNNRLAGADPRESYFMDGGVLDNFPFGHAIEAISRRPAATEVDRKLIYIEPDPGAMDTGKDIDKPDLI